MLRHFCIIAISFLSVEASAQNAVDITPEKNQYIRYQDITTDSAGNLYAFYNKAFHSEKGRFLQYSNDAWTDLTPVVPAAYYTMALKGMKAGFALTGYSPNWERFVGTWDTKMWQAIPYKQLKGNFTTFTVDERDDLWFGGTFGSRSVLARWRNNSFSYNERFPETLDTSKHVERVFAIGTDQVVQMQYNPLSEKFFAVTDGNNWIFAKDARFPVVFDQKLAAINNDWFYVATDCGDAKNKCILGWEASKNKEWALLPFNNAFLNDEILDMTMDHGGNLLVAGRTRNSEGYVVLKWDGVQWSQFGPAVDKPIRDMVAGKNALYAITGEDRSNIVMIPAYTASVPNADADAKYLKLDTKAAEVWQLTQEYLATEDRLVREVNKDYNLHNDSIRRMVVDSLRFLRQHIENTQKAFKKLKLKQGQSPFADFVQERLSLMHIYAVNSSIGLSVSANVNGDIYRTMFEKSVLAVKQMLLRYHVYEKEFRRRHGF